MRFTILRQYRQGADLTAQWEVVEAFLAAAREGNFDALVAVLHPQLRSRVRRLRVPLDFGAPGGGDFT